MVDTIEYDDSNLQHLFTELEPKQRLKALRSAFAQEANRVRKVAVSNLRASLNSNRELEKGIRKVVFKKKAGFQITIKPRYSRKERKAAKADQVFGFQMNKKKHRKVPVLIFAEGGTKDRYYDVKKRSSLGFRYSTGKKRYTGHLKAYRFMEKTQKDVDGSVTENLHNAIRQHIQKTAKKYGCK